jgi:hypothetical protein
MTGTYLKLPQRFIKEDLAVTKLYRDGNHAMGVSSKDSDENGIGSPPSYESEVLCSRKRVLEVQYWRQAR